MWAKVSPMFNYFRIVKMSVEFILTEMLIPQVWTFCQLDDEDDAGNNHATFLSQPSLYQHRLADSHKVHKRTSNFAGIDRFTDPVKVADAALEYGTANQSRRASIKMLYPSIGSAQGSVQNIMHTWVLEFFEAADTYTVNRNASALHNRVRLHYDTQPQLPSA